MPAPERAASVPEMGSQEVCQPGGPTARMLVEAMQHVGQSGFPGADVVKDLMQKWDQVCVSAGFPSAQDLKLQADTKPSDRR
jgi:hypothetical protein